MSDLFFLTMVDSIYGHFNIFNHKYSYRCDLVARWLFIDLKNIDDEVVKMTLKEICSKVRGGGWSEEWKNLIFKVNYNGIFKLKRVTE